MADNENSTDTPLTPRRAGTSATNPLGIPIPTQGTSGVSTELDQENYTLRLESELQELRSFVQDLQHQQQTQTSQAPIPSAVTTQSVTPPITIPFPSTQQQFYFPFSQGAYTYPYLGSKPPCTYTQFLDCKPSVYHGSTNPNVTLNWLREMVKALDACNCENHLRVRFAAQMLKGDAMNWWDFLTGFGKISCRARSLLCFGNV